MFLIQKFILKKKKEKDKDKVEAYPRVLSAKS